MRPSWWAVCKTSGAVPTHESWHGYDYAAEGIDALEGMVIVEIVASDVMTSKNED